MAVAERGLAYKCSCLSDAFGNRFAMSCLWNNTRTATFAAWRTVASRGFQSQCADCCPFRIGLYFRPRGRMAVPKALYATDLCASTACVKPQTRVRCVCAVGAVCVGFPAFQAFQIEHWGVSIEYSGNLMYLERHKHGAFVT